MQISVTSRTIMVLWLCLTMTISPLARPVLAQSDNEEKLIPAEDAWKVLSRVDMPLLKDEDRQRAKLTLQECIHRALQFSHDIQAATYSPGGGDD